MEVKYDKVADAVYVNVSHGKVVKTVEMDDRLIVDLDNAGNIVGLELLDASSQESFVRALERNVETGIPVSITSATPHQLSA